MTYEQKKNVTVLNLFESSNVKKTVDTLKASVIVQGRSVRPSRKSRPPC
jgi:hypothetical protein